MRVRVDWSVLINISNSQDAACLVMDVPIRREIDGKVIMLCMSLAEFNKIPIEQIVTVNPDETLNSSNLFNLSFVFGKLQLRHCVSKMQKRILLITLQQMK